MRVIAADALELWLESAPAVALWLARQIGKVVSGGVRDLEAFWEEWSLSTKPPMTTDVVIGGRTENVKEIHRWLSQPPGVLEVQGDSPDEAFAFLYAAIMSLSATDSARALSRCVILEDIGQFRECVQACENLIIAAPARCLEAAGSAVAKGHHVFIAMDATAIDIRGGLRLSRPHREAFEKALRASGFSETEAQHRTRESGRSIPVLRRQLSLSDAVRLPTWAKLDSAQLLLTVLLAGAWDDGREGDRHVIETLSGLTYDSFAGKLEAVISVDDSPLRHVGNVWTLKAPLDAWFLLASHLDAQFLKRFRQSINAVLTETDPKYDLPPDKRWAASLYGKTSRYSEWLRRGLVESLTLFAVYGDRAAHNAGGVAFQGLADAVVNDTLGAADTWQAWASLKDVTPLLAEAAEPVNNFETLTVSI